MRMPISLAGISLAACLTSSLPAAGAEQLTIPAGSTGGSIYTWAATATGLLNKQQQSIQYAARSGGLVENVALLQSGEVKIAVTSGFDYYGWTKGKAPQESNLRTVYMIMPLVSFLVLPKAAPEKTLAELRGQPIQLGPRTSASYPFHKLVLEALGLEEKAFKIFALSAGAGAEAYAEGKVYANLFLTGLPRPPALERMMQSERGVKTVFYTEQELKTITTKFPVIKTVDIPPDQLQGLTAPVKVPAVWAELVVRNDFPDEAAYAVTRILHEQYQALVAAFPPAIYSTPENTITNRAFVLHPGSERYLREKSLLKN